MSIDIKALLFAAALMSSGTAIAAPLLIDSIKAKSPVGGAELRFPKLAGNGANFRAINLYLFAVELQQRPARDAKAALILPEDGSLSALDYEIVGDNGRVLSIRISGTRSGVGFSHLHNFDVASGLPILLADLFTPEGYGRLRTQVATPRVQRIRDFQQTLNPKDDLQSEQREVYEDCLPSVRGDTLTDNQLLLAIDHLALERPDCTTPDQLELDVLRPLKVKLPLAALAPDLGPYGSCALLPAASAPACTLPPKQGLRLGSYAGTIGDKEKINLVVERLYDGDRVDASWSREADGRYHRLQGRVQRNGKAKLFETEAGSEALLVEFTLFGKADGSFAGQWRTVTGGSALKPLELKVLQ
ncbi:hypothetical protein [Nevskia sp.]|uniref:hypothetical protein n=1 Tax=Nevskia sp. TaxID=1929292 RepID=UPI0025F31A0C|nr:hypothetical protein [Nevskia sp.]